MTNNQLTEIIRTTNQKKIAKQLNEFGYTLCNKDHRLGKINVIELVKAIMFETVDFADDEHKYLFNGRICGTVKGYENYEFVIVNKYDIKKANDVLDDEEMAIQTNMFIWAKEIER
ncbi:MAG: hypothetical protein HDT29_06820 [Clostridiales bacterium]|nr:hypothetical protein [Clostridiales bacterium]